MSDNITKLNGQLHEVMSAIEECTADGWWDWYIQDDTEYMSPMFWEILGYDKEKDNMPDKPSAWQEKIHPEDLTRAIDAFNKHVDSKGKYPFNLEVRYTHKAGHTVWVICKGKVLVWDEDDKPIRMVGVHIDITQLKETELALEEKIKELESRDKTLRSLRELLDISKKVAK